MRGIAWLLRLVTAALAGALLIVAITVAIAPRAWHAIEAHEEVPVELPPFEALAQRTYVYDAAGNQLTVYELENSQPITDLSVVPADVLAAILAVEDSEFYNHQGVDLRSSVRAALSNFSTDSARQGASTVTQQVVKNEYLGGLERDGRYKLLQVHYAILLEKEMAKNDILLRYINTIFFGNNAYGLQAAAETYFAKDVSELTMVEGAFLAGLIRSPSGYDPITRPERSRARFGVVLDRLVDEGMLTATEADLLKVDWILPERVRESPTIQQTRTYYTEALRDYLLNRSTFLGETEQERYNQLFRGGLRIYTTFDPHLQQLAEQARALLPDTPGRDFEAAIVSLDAKTGAIRAMVGGKGFAENRQINMALVPRQTGSSIKMFILAAALQAGAQPNDTIDGPSHCEFPNPGDVDDPVYEVDAVGIGVGTLSEMTSRSINCAYIRLSQIVGLNRVVDTTYRAARSTYLYPGQPPEERDPIQPFLSFAAGANEMSPLDMASGAQTLANNGVHNEPYYVDHIDRADGTRMYTHENVGVQVFDEGVALTATSVLKGVLTSGTARCCQLEGGRPAAGKTGTQDENTNAWFVGYTPQLVTAVWVGDPKGLYNMECVPEFIELSAASSCRVQGGRIAAPLWKAFMDPAHEGLPEVDWSAPPQNARRPARLYLPGQECLAQVVSGTLPGTPTSAPASAPTTLPADPNAPPADPNAPPAEETTTTRATVVIRTVDPGTTISPDNLDPRAPLPTADPKYVVYDCARGAQSARTGG